MPTPLLEENASPIKNFEAHTAVAADSRGTLNTLAGGGVAVLTDIGTSLFNSITPERFNVTTHDVLSRISNNAVQIYNENPETIQAISFVGGLAVPIGVSIKGLNLLRSGAKGANFFSDIGRSANLKRVEDAYKNSGKSSVEYIAARNDLYKAMVGNAVVDNVVAEAAILLTLNAHPYMEDYQKDLGTNALIAVGLGSTIQAGVGRLITASSIRAVTSAVDKEFTTVASKIFAKSPVNKYEPIGVQITRRNQRVENLKAWIANAEDPKSAVNLSPLTIDSLKIVQRQEEARMVDAFLKSGNKEMEDFFQKNVDIRDFFLEKAKGADFMGMDRIKFASANIDAVSQLERSPIKGLKDRLALFVTRTNKKTNAVTVHPRDAMYSPVHNAWFSVREGVDYLGIADLGKTLKQIELSVDRSIGKIARPDQALNNLIEHASVIEEDFAKSLIGIGKMDVEQLKRLVVAPDDLSVLKAIEARMLALRTAGIDTSKIKIKVAGEAPSINALEVRALRQGGVTPGMLSQLRNIAAKDWDKYTIGNPNIRYNKLDPALVQEISTSETSRKLRDTLYRLSDADGYVYLYKAPIKGDGFDVLRLSSIGLKNPTLYKVHVDDIAGSLETKVPELIAKRSAQITDEFQSRTAIPLNSKELSGAPDSKFLTDNTISQHLATVNTNEIRGLAKLHIGIEAIAARTGTPIDAVRAILAGEDFNASFSRFTNIQDIEEAIVPTNRSLQVGANVDKVPTAEMQATLNRQTSDSISQAVIEYNLRTSPSAFVRRIADDLNTDEIKAQIHFLKEEIADVTASGIKSTLLRSADSVLEDLGEVGKYATALGKQRINAGNRIIDAITQPMASAFAIIAKKPEALIELNTAINVNAAQAGYRFYRNGQFWTMGKGSGKIGIDEISKLSDEEFDLLKAFKDKNTGETAIDAVTFNNKEYVVKSPEVREALQLLQEGGRDMYHLANSYNKSIGKGNLNDIGMWVPAFNVRDKQVAYAFNKVTQQTSMLLAKNVEELQSGVKAYAAAQGENIRNIDIVFKGKDQEAYNRLAGRHDPMYMEVADLSKQHSGASATALVSTGTDVMTDVIRSYDTYINRHLDNAFNLKYTPLLDQFKNLSDVSQIGFSDATLGNVARLTRKPVDPGKVLHNVILGKPNLNQHPAWAEWQERGQVVTDFAIKTVAEILAPVLTPLTKGLKSSRKPEDWERITQQMEAKGIVNPFQILDTATGNFVVSKELGQTQFLKQGELSTQGLTPRTVALGNALAATSLLRFMELAQPLVNILSLPILTSGAVRRSMSASLAGTKLKSDPVFSTGATMMDGIRMMNHPTAAKKWDDLANQANLYGRDWQEVNAIMHQSRSVDRGPISLLEDAMESKVVQFMSKPADMSEALVRRVSFFNGITLAKRAYPGISDAGAMTFARDFMDKAIGNYTAPQRPAMFQGTFGMGLGLFQTYVLTLAQNMFRHIEHRQFAQLGKMMLTQATIFGGVSLPGFDMVSQAIGDNFSDANIDLETGTMRAIGKGSADLVLYGLPSQLVGLHTRGDIQPRIPNPFQGLNSVAAINLTGQVFKAGRRLAEVAGQADPNVGRAMLEALSMQSVSRPLARMSELATGVSVTSRGNVVSRDAELYTNTAIISRIFATRPIEEIKARDAMHLNTLYGSLDREKRSVITTRLRSLIRSGNLTDERVSELAFEYLRTGTPTGWRSAVNEAIAQSVQPGSATVRNSLDPRSPTNLMIDDLDGGE